MKSLLHELQDNESVLLMYLANELPAQDRAEVEHMLGRDDRLRLALATIRDGYEGYHATMRRMDAAMPPVSAFAAARAIGDAVRYRQNDPSSLDEHEERRRRIHWGLYPVAAAALILVGMFVWWEAARDDMSRPPVMVTTIREFGQQPDHFEPNADPNLGDPTAMSDAQILRMFGPIVIDRGYESQRQLSALNYLDQTLQ